MKGAFDDVLYWLDGWRVGYDTLVGTISRGELTVGDGVLFRYFRYVSLRLWLRFVLCTLVQVVYITGRRKLRRQNTLLLRRG